jgi:histidyl-tRNA synthetase
MGYLSGLGVPDALLPKVTGQLDKQPKIGSDKVIEGIISLGLTRQIAEKALALITIAASDDSFVDAVKSLNVKNDMLETGLMEMSFVAQNLSHLPKGAFKVDLGIIRGLDYYTGTILEAGFQGSAGGAIGAGGRYDDLAGAYINRHLPGIGVSIGLTRLFASLLDQGLITPKGKAPTDILVVLPDETRRAESSKTAHILRQKGLKVELYHTDGKIKNQLAYAEKKGIPFVWFPPFKDGAPHELKDMKTGEQMAASLDALPLPLTMKRV